MNDKQIEALLKAHGIRLTANRILIARTLSGLDNPASIKEVGSKRFKRLTSQIFSVHYHCSNSNI